MAALAALQPAAANNVTGAWSAVFNWPIIAVHTVLTPDSRVMSYGTDSGRHADRLLRVRHLGRDRGPDGQRPRDAPEYDKHRHLLQLAARAADGRQHLRRGRRQLRQRPHDEHGQQQQQPLQLHRQHAHAWQQHESRALVQQLDGAADGRDLHPGR
jgi:hypothetical protein